MTELFPSTAPERYPLGRSDAETRRLILQHQIYGPLTRQFLRDAGITAGMKVLDLGSGAGDVALLLADLVGPQGQVVGLDVNPDILDLARSRAEAAGWTTVTFRQADLEHLDVSSHLDDDFDAVVGRWVLMFLDDPTGLLRHLRTYLRPGGIVAFQESDLTIPVRTYPSAPLHGWLADVMVPGAAPPDGETGLKLFRAFVAAGLPAPQLCVHSPAGGGDGWPGYAYLAATVRSILPHLEQAHGLRPHDLGLDTLEGRLRDEVVGSDGIQILTTVVGASTRA